MAAEILLLGKDGQAGWELQRSLLPLGPLTALGRRDLDLTDRAALEQGLQALAPRIIVNAAAYTAVDKAEQDVELAMAVNATVPAILADYCHRSGALLVHYSTDYVFDGAKEAPYREDDATGPLSVYGASKLAGEQAIIASGAAALLLRVSWVFGEQGNNFVKTILRLAAERDGLRVVADQFGAPTPAAFIADATALLLAALRQRPLPAGMATYHLSTRNPVSWHGFAQAIVAMAAEIPGFALKLGPEQIAAITTADYPLPARRPANSRLDTGRIEQDFGLHIPDWQPYLQRLLQQLAIRQGGRT
ncbi:MAG: dTDP-4-dehydrorhamnose reductase [Pseudomonadota bacterium]|jgi:dTDP-4-dehydrorhamnose reductase